MTKLAENRLQEKSHSLKKRIDHHRRLGRTLKPDSALGLMNESAMLAMETKLFKLRRQRPDQGS